jgi:hypothetical protein
MKGGVFNRPECCNQPCECPVCLENKHLMKLNCNHYVCLDDIQHIINSNPRRLQKCPICRTLIANYGCNGNITNVANNNPPNTIPYEENPMNGEETDDDIYVAPNVNVNGYETDGTNPRYGGKRKRKRSRKSTKRRNTIPSCKNNKRRKTKSLPKFKK